MIFRSIYSKPVLLVGNGIRTAGAAEFVYQFAKKTNIPVLTTMNAVDLAQDDIHIGFIGTHGNRIANMVLGECDLIVSVGARLGLRQVGRYTDNFAPKAKLIRVDIDEYELSRNIKKDEEKHQIDAKFFMQSILDEDVPDYSDWKNKILKAKNMLDKYDKQEGNLAVESISSLLPKNPIIAVDVGMHQCWCAQSLVLKGHHGRILISGGYGTMGCALPFAIGASIATNNSIVYCIAGDGGFQMNIQELETIMREKLPIKIFVLNNKVLGKISETQHLNHEDRYANTTFEGGYTVPDFKKIAEAYGIRAFSLNSYKELYMYQDYIIDPFPCLINIALSENAKLTPKIRWETGAISPQLDAETYQKVKHVLD